MSMRDSIAHIIINDHDQHISAASTADAILAALPEMIASLVWEKSKNSNVCMTKMSLGLEYRLQISLSGKAMWSVNTNKRWYNAVDEVEAKVHINTHHRAAIMAAFTGETQ